MDADNPKKKKRPRIMRALAQEAHTEIKSNHDDGYRINCASQNAKFLFSFDESWVHEFWIDKHYTDRQYFGDDNGPRHGIEQDIVESLVKRSIPHLFYYSLKHNFSFINFPPRKKSIHRVVLQELSNTLDTLNVVAEFHFLDKNKYEITVITAMRIDGFKIQDNQYVIQFSDEESLLCLMRNKTLQELDGFS